MVKIKVDGRWGYEIPCKICDIPMFKTTSDFNRANKKGKSLYCSKECSSKGISQTLKKPFSTFICEYCETEYYSNRKYSKYCSKNCFAKDKTDKKQYQCGYCFREVFRTDAQKKNKIYCSKECADKGYSGKDNPRWIEDRSKLKDQSERKSLEYKEWRILVFVRDGYTCAHCNTVGGIINAHHIKPFRDYPELRMSVDNGITLCKKCHKEEHKRKSTMKLVEGLHNAR